MNILVNCLPQDISNSDCHELIDSAPLSTWMPVLERLQKEFDLPNDQWARIPKGANALFQLGDDVIVKLVPPNWRQQGEKEILVAPLLEGKLSLQTPRLIGSGVVDNWVFVIFTRLPGSSLADVWSSLDIEQKRAMMGQVGQLLRELRLVTFDEDISIKVDWQHYVQHLISACLARHQRRGMPAHLLEQVMPYIEATGEFASPSESRFIHMDIHPWNLMAAKDEERWTLTGLLDFGDAIVGNCDQFELLTPMIFMAQGEPILIKALIDSYGLLGECNAQTLQRQLMTFALIRPDSDVGFCMQQVPVSGPRDTWGQIAEQMFPM